MEPLQKDAFRQGYDTCCWFPDTSRMQDGTKQMVYSEFADVSWSVPLLDNSEHSGKLVLGRNIIGVKLQVLNPAIFMTVLSLLHSFRLSGLLERDLKALDSV